MAKETGGNYIKELLDSQKDSNRHLRDLVQWEKEGMRVEQEELSDVREKLSELHSAVGTAANTAQTLSKNLGAEEAFTREMSHEMAMVFSKDKDMQVAYQKASVDDKADMVKQIKDGLMEKYKQAGLVTKENEKFIANAMTKVDASMDEIVEKGSKLLYPVITGITRSLDAFRHTMVEALPQSMKFVGRFLSDEMMEHYKTGAKEIGGHFKTHMSTIMAPLDALTGPLVAVGKSMFTIGKTLFSGPTKYEKETAKVQREIRDAVGHEGKEKRKQWFVDRKDRMKDRMISTKRWLLERKLRLKEYFASKGKSSGEFLKKLLIPLLALGVGFVIGYMKQVKQLLSPILRFFKSIGTKFPKIGTFFTKVAKKMDKVGKTILKFLTKGPISRIFLAAGKVFGRLYMPLKMLWNFFKDFGKIKEMFAAGDIVGILKHIAASILQPILELPEMFINGLSWLFGSELRVDFGKEGIMEMIDNVTVWVFDHITVPVMDFITKTIPEFFGKIKEFFDNIIGGVMKTGKKIMSFFGFGGDDKKEEDSSGKPKTLDDRSLNKQYKKGIKDGSIDPEITWGQYREDIRKKELGRGDVSKNIDPPQKTSGPAKAKAEQGKSQLDGTRVMSDKIDQTNNKISETNKTNQQLVNNQQNINVNVSEPIPTETENMGVFMMNNSWGVGGA